MLENNLEQMYSSKSGLEMYTSAKPIKLSSNFGTSPIGGPMPMRAPSHPEYKPIKFTPINPILDGELKLYSGTLGKCPSGVIRPIKPTETFKVDLSEVYPKLNLTEKYHSPKFPEFKLPSYEPLFGIEKKKGSIFSDGKINL